MLFCAITLQYILTAGVWIQFCSFFSKTVFGYLRLPESPHEFQGGFFYLYKKNHCWFWQWLHWSVNHFAQYWHLNNAGIPCFSKVRVTPLCFYEKPVWVPIFTTWCPNQILAFTKKSHYHTNAGPLRKHRHNVKFLKAEGYSLLYIIMADKRFHRNAVLQASRRNLCKVLQPMDMGCVSIYVSSLVSLSNHLQFSSYKPFPAWLMLFYSFWGYL